jgi:hypothetical protein
MAGFLPRLFTAILPRALGHKLSKAHKAKIAVGLQRYRDQCATG